MPGGMPNTMAAVWSCCRFVEFVKPMRDQVKFNFGDMVYRKVNPDTAGIVTGIVFRPTGTAYLVTWGAGEETACYDFELTTERCFKETES